MQKQTNKQNKHTNENKTKQEKKTVIKWSLLQED